MSRVIASFLIAAVLSLAGCVRISKTSDIEELKGKVAKLEQRTQSLEESLRLSERMASMEARLSQISASGGGGGGGQAASQPATAETATPKLPESAAPRAGRQNPERYGGDYRQGIGTDPPSLDPAHISDTTSHRVALNIFDGLVEFSDEDLSIQPAIATSWTVSPDGKIFTFTLREDVKFHNGRLVTAEDFVYSYTRMLDPRTASERAWLFEEILGYAPLKALMAARGQVKFHTDGQLEKIEAARLEESLRMISGIQEEELTRAGLADAKAVMDAAAKTKTLLEKLKAALASGSAELAKVPADKELLTALEGFKLEQFIAKGISAPDKKTLRLELAKPFAPFLTVLAMPNAAVVPREEVEKWGDQFARHPVGTGAFKFANWEKNVSIELSAFDDYFLGRPYVDTMRFRVLPDDVARLYEFEIGNLESINEVPDEKYESIKANKDFPGVLEEKPTLSVYYMGFNVTKKPFDNPLVRKAFNYAVRKDVILNVIRRGRGTLANGVLPPGMPGYDASLKGYNYDKQKAIDLLKEAGYADPASLGEIEYWYNATSANDPNAKLAEVIQQNLLEIGVKTRLQSTDWGTYLKKLDRGELGLFRLAWVADYPDPDNFMYVLFHSLMKGEAGNHAFYGNAKVDELLDKARRVIEMKERIPLYQEAERQIVEDAPWIFLYHAKLPFLRKPYVKGVTLTAMGPDAMRMRGVYFDKDLMKAK